MVKELDKPIQYKELYPITLAAAAWGENWATLRVCFNRDYRSVVDCIHSGTSHCPHTFSHAGLPQTGPKGGTPPHTHPSVTQQADTTHYLHTSLPLSTRSAYSSAARSSTHFCTLTTASTRMALPYQRLSTPSCSSLPTSPTPSGLSYLDVFTYSISTGASLTPRRASRIHILLRGIKRGHGCQPDRRLPITPSPLRAFHSHLNLHYHDYLTILGGLPGSLLWILRSGELLELRWQDPERCQAGHQVSIRASKTDPFRQGALGVWKRHSAR